MKLLISHDGALGDFILSLPLIQSLTSTHRASEVHLIGRPTPLSLLPLIHFIHHGTSSDSQIFCHLYTDPPSLPPALGTFLSHFNKAFIFSRKRDSTVFKNIKKHCPHVLHIQTIPELHEKIHVTDYQKGQIEGLINTNHHLNSQLLAPCQRDLKNAQTIIDQRHIQKRKVFTVHPGSGGKKKCWPLPYYIEWIKRADKEFSPLFLILSGPAEEDSLDQMEKLLSESGIKKVHMIHDQPLPVIAALLSLSSLYIGNDSGISHLASKLTRTLVIFGPTDPVLWAPGGKNITLIPTFRSCAPCTEIRYRSCREQKCLSELSVDRVWNVTLNTLLKESINKRCNCRTLCKKNKGAKEKE